MMNRKKKKEKVDLVLGEVLGVIEDSNKPMATQEIADELEKPWHSIQTRCLKLQIEGRVTGFRVGRMNLWQINPLFSEVRK